MSKLRFRAVRADEIRPGARLWLMGAQAIWVKVEAVLEGMKALVTWTQTMPEGDLQQMRATVPLGDLAVQLETEGDPLAPTRRPEADRPATQLVYPPGISSGVVGDIGGGRPYAAMIVANMQADSTTFRLWSDGCPIKDENPDLACLFGPHTDGTVVQSSCTACPHYQGHHKTARVVIPGILVPSQYRVACGFRSGRIGDEP